MSKVLVTGGAGFIGSNLARLLLDEGREVTVYDNLSSGYRQNVEAMPGARFVEGDVRDAVGLRYFNVYGVNQHYDAYGNCIPIFAHRMLRGETVTIFGDGEQTRDFVNVRDVARENLLASEARGVSGAFNVASATSITINRLVELMSEASGLRPEVVYGPPRK